MASTAPTSDHKVLIAGCGTDGTCGTDKKEYHFTCEPHLGYHFFSYGSVVYNEFLQHNDSTKALCTYPAAHVKAYIALGKGDWGEIAASACYTINPQENCKPHYVGVFMNAKAAIRSHKFSMIHIDHAASSDEMRSFDALKNTLLLALELLEDGGVLYWDVFNQIWVGVNGNWDPQKENKVSLEDWNKLTDEITKRTDYWSVAGVKKDRWGKVVDRGNDIYQGDVWQINGLVVWKPRPTH